MSKLRISIVEFLNTAPLVWGFTDGPLAGSYDLSFTVPSQCAEALRAGRADVGIIPAIEYQRMDGMVVLPGMAIAAKNEVRSLLVLAKMPIEMAQAHCAGHQFAQLGRRSRGCSAAATGISTRNSSTCRPIRKPCWPRADAALVIGDPALRVRLKVDALQPRARRRTAVAAAMRASIP